MMGLGFPETRHSSSTVSPSRTTSGDLPRGTVRLGGTEKEKNRRGTDTGLEKANNCLQVMCIEFYLFSQFLYVQDIQQCTIITFQLQLVSHLKP